MTYQERIRQLREDHDLSQSMVAETIHVAQTTYSDYENGKIRVPIESLISLARLYDVDLNYISCITKEKKPFPKAT